MQESIVHVHLMSSQFLAAATMNTVLIVNAFATRAKVYIKSTPSTC